MPTNDNQDAPPTIPKIAPTVATTTKMNHLLLTCSVDDEGGKIDGGLVRWGATSRPSLKDDLDRSNRQCHHSSHLEARAEENDPTLPREEAPPDRIRRKAPTSITFESINSEDED